MRIPLIRFSIFFVFCLLLVIQISTAKDKDEVTKSDKSTLSIFKKMKNKVQENFMAKKIYSPEPTL